MSEVTFIEASPKVQKLWSASNWLLGIALLSVVIALIVRSSIPWMVFFWIVSIILAILTAVLKATGFKQYIQDRNKYLPEKDR